MFEYMNFHYAPWGMELAIYFFLIGTAAMTFALAAAPTVFGGVTSSLAGLRFPATVVTLGLIGVCGILLIMDLGQPGRFLYPILHFHASSPLSWGALLLLGFAGCVAGFAYALMTKKDGLLRPLGIAGSVLALTMPLYTGIDLMSNQSRELWNSPTVPMLFVVLSITSGAGLMAVLSMVTGGSDEVTGTLRGVMMVSVGLTLGFFVTEWVRLAYGSEELLMAWAIINNEFGTRFWLLTLVVGIVVPLAILLMPSLNRQPALVAAAGVAGAVGAFSFREVILYAGQLVQSFY